ncbi:MAG: choice-of-anchor R domain-containing protein [Patescibacteria group bacterium]
MIIKKMNQKKGQIMIGIVIMFVVISLSVVSGIAWNVQKETLTESNLSSSAKSYYSAEAITEDVVYRIKNEIQVSSTETININNAIGTAIISDSAGIKTVSSSGNFRDAIRKVSVSLTEGSGVSFNYGVQVGQGGINLTGSGTVNGNVYANGPITGDSSAIITGTAISANSPALTADQSNDTGVPPYNVVFGNASGTQDIAQSFKVATESPLNKIQLYIKKTGAPSNATVKIVNDASGSPGTTIFASGTLSASTVTTSYGWIDVTFSTNPLLDVSTTYWLVVDAGTSSNKYYTIGASNGGYINGLGKIGQMSGTWNNTTPSGLDYYFSIYLGGLNGLIAGNSGSQWNQLHIGTVSGTAQAHTVNYTNATGNIYCQTGTGNNKSCTSQTDPTYIAFPVSDANITEWKNDAVAGGVYNGNYSVGSTGATLGPKKIIGNLTISGGGILTVSGTLWVTGNITLNGGGTIKLASSYGSNDGVIIADGNISISGGGNATGSGTAGSYLMMLSTSSSGDAISISGGSGAVIVYAPNGTIEIEGGASLKEVTGYKIKIEGGSSITYESGLTNNNFSSGPGGGYNISSWGETE